MKNILLISSILLFTLSCEDQKSPKKTDKKTEVSKPVMEKAEKKATKISPTSAPTSDPKKKEEAKKKAALPPMMKKGEKLNFGGEFTIKGKAITLSAALKAGPSPKPQKISGKIAKVCKKKGCWFTLKTTDKKEVRVRMKDYGFFVPRNAEEGDTIVEGILSQRVLPQKEAQHYADDAAEAGEKPKVITEDQKIFELMVSAVQITKP